MSAPDWFLNNGRPQYWRVTAEVTYTGEWFVYGGHASSPEEAAEFIRDNADMERPENMKIAPVAIVNEREIWLTNEYGTRIEE